jgi:hypothetical protein
LKPEINVGFNAPVVWTTATAYTAGSSTVFNGSGFYRCLITHTSGTFATDLAALKWQLIVNLAAVPLVAASQIAVTPSGNLTTDVQGSLQALDAGKHHGQHILHRHLRMERDFRGELMRQTPDHRERAYAPRGLRRAAASARTVPICSHSRAVGPF